MGYQTYDEARWIFDFYGVICDQRAVNDSDFTDGTTYDEVEWFSTNAASVRQITKKKYISRRQIREIKLFKKIYGKYFVPGEIDKYRTTASQTPPQAGLPFDSDIWSSKPTEFDEDWYLVGINATFGQDGSVKLVGHWKKTYNWELVLAQTPE